MGERIGGNIGIRHGDLVDPVDDRGRCCLGLEVECDDDTDTMPISEEDRNRYCIRVPVGSSSQGL